MKRIFVMGAAAALLAACGTTGPGFLAEQIVHPTDETMTKRCEAAGFKWGDGRPSLIAEIEKAAAARDFTGLVDRFLDCVLIDVPESDPELKLLRGHYALALIATYGAFNQTGALADFGEIDFRASSKAKDQAALMLAHIERAEDYLRRASPRGIPAQFAASPSQADALPAEMQRVRKDYRVLSVLRVAVDAERPTVERARGIVVDVFAAAASPTPGGLAEVVHDGFNGMLKSLVMDYVGRDFLHDVQEKLADVKKHGPVRPEDWAFGDKLLDRACVRLAETADVLPHCVP